MCRLLVTLVASRFRLRRFGGDVRGFAKSIAALVVAWAASGAPTAVAQSAPTVDPVIAAYKDYRASEQRGDDPAADAALVRALALSEARDGDGGSTAILAMDLATLRMETDHKADALAPARRALALARAGAKGVDELAARLMVGEAELSVQPQSDEADLLAALHDADARGADIDAYAYPAAVALGTAATQSGRWANAESAWRSAERHIHGSPGDAEPALAAVYLGDGLALIGAGRDADASKVLTKAVDLLAPLSPESADAAHVTTAEVELADAMAWLGAVRARQLSENPNTMRPGPLDTKAGRPGLPGRPPLCRGTVAGKPLPTFPAHMLREWSVGAGVLQLQTDDTGAVTHAVLLASVPGDEFRPALTNPAVHWVFTPVPNQVGCRLASTDRLVVVNFIIGQPR